MHNKTEQQKTQSRAETNNRIFSTFVCYPTIRISDTVYQIFVRLTTLLAVAS